MIGGECTALMNTSSRAPRDRGERGQLFEQGRGRVLLVRTRRCGLQRAQAQQRLDDDPLACSGVARAPRAIQRADLTLGDARFRRALRSTTRSDDDWRAPTAPGISRRVRRHDAGANARLRGRRELVE